MAHWLIKSEPVKWSWDDQVKAGAEGTHWDGVRNHAAKLNLMAMRRGDQAFFYHSNEGKEIVGIAAVIREAYPDPGDPTGKFVMVDVAAVRPLEAPVTLAAVKDEPRLAEMALIKFSRLSVQPVTDAEWAIVLEMAGEAPDGGA